MAVAGVESFGQEADIGSAEKFDELAPSEVFTVLDADGSQMEAILRGRGRQNLVIQGPPGTGKSQTIANLIALFLRDGKKILFVSEKMAALSVVHRRLEEVGLGDFCLEIHSDKANKRDTLGRIDRATRVEPPQLRQQVHAEFSRLLEFRQELNEYVRSLHEPVLKGKSAFDVHGELAKLENAPLTSADLAIDVQSLEPSAEEAIFRLIRRIAQSPEIFSSYFTFPWYGTSVTEWSMTHQTEIELRSKTLREDILSVSEVADRLASKMKVDSPSAPRDLKGFGELVEMFTSSPCPPDQWLAATDLGLLRDRANELEGAQTIHSTIREELLKLYQPGLFEQSDTIAIGLDTSDWILPAALNGQADKRDIVFDTATTWSSRLNELRSGLQIIQESATELSRLLGRQLPRTLSDCRETDQLGLLVAADPRPTNEWFDGAALPRLMQVAQEASSKAARRDVLRSQLLSEYDEGIFALGFSDWRTAFEADYSSVLRLFNGAYRAKSSTLRRLSKSKKALPYNAALAALQSGAELDQIEDWLTTHETQLAEGLGSHFVHWSTDWTKVQSSLSDMQRLQAAYGPEGIPTPLQALLKMSGQALVLVARHQSRLSEALVLLDNEIRLLQSDVSLEALLGSPLDNFQTEQALARLDVQNQRLESFVNAVVAVRSNLRPGKTRSASQICEDVTQAQKANSIERQLEGSRQDLLASYGHFFIGLQTDWPRTLSALDWTVRFKSTCMGRGYGEECIRAACDEATVRDVQTLAGEFRRSAAGTNAGVDFLFTVFDKSLLAARGVEFSQLSFQDSLAWLQTRLKSIGDLNDWVQFQSLCNQGLSMGIGSFIYEAMDRRIESSSLEAALRKRLLESELGVIYKIKPRLQTFLWRDQEDLIQRFRDLDRRLMRVFSDVVKSAIIQRQPNLNASTNAGQLAFLRREITKQRRHAPLRRLFAQAGNVVLEITPCLMMSPLSVATYLPKDSVSFDVVIFDEASQMPAEEAVGSILRGNQLIVAGDPRQLPPTRFFERTIEETEDTLEEETVESLESVLEDCAAASMQRAMLEWHYRSRHESLIAFSNAEFYENRLVTFPPPTSVPPEGVGIRLEFVEGGLYDRGRSRTNRKEARTVANLIERHLDRWAGKRSLGVIALSAAQALAVTEELERLLLRRPDLEPLLTDEFEPFFIKPLENVQGDERDSIIITIGYGKDSSGALSHFFGPINQLGGERRLNVAVTRAKWELTIVASILASDIDESRVSSIGPKSLKRFLSYAREGKLPPDMTAPTGESESPFEEAVWTALNSAGLEVDKNVGVSRYRIDLAVKDPRQPGRYLLGIECDGAMYHSSFVARDRDRLRQQNLETQGWIIHRIWSTDWARNPRGCLQRVLEHIRQLLDEDNGGSAVQLGQPQPPLDDRGDDDNNLVSPPPELSSQSIVQSEPESDDIGSYLPFSPSSYLRQPFYDNTPLVRRAVVEVVENEGPIHRDVVLIRVARAFDLKRTGTIVEDTINSQISYAVSLKTVRQRGEFLWPATSDTVLVRQPTVEGSLRNIVHVPPEELEKSVLVVAKRARGITIAELVPEAARLLGYQRTGDNIREVFLAIVAGLLSKGRLREQGEFVFATIQEHESATNLRQANDGLNGDVTPSRVDDLITALRPFVAMVRNTPDPGGLPIPDELAVLSRNLSMPLRIWGQTLWLTGGPDLRNRLAPLGFKFEPNGALATFNKAAWCLVSSGPSELQRA